MSGDVQPRKRKDKKKRRDGLDRKSEGELSFSRHSSFEDDESSHGVHITKMGTEDVHFHVQHEHGTGGHWCAKIFFFSLLAILFGLVGLIILENRGISDLDTPLSESRFSNYFDGWVDESRQEHDDHDPVQASIEEHDEHDEPFEEEEDHSELDEDADEEHDDDDDEQEEAEDEDATTEQTKEEEDDDEERDEDNDNEDEDEDDEEDATQEATVEQSNEAEENEDDDNDVDNVSKNEGEEDDDEEDENVTQEATKEEEEDDDDEADDNDEDENNTNEKTVEVSQEANDDDDNDNEADENDSNANAADDDDDDAEDDDDNSVEPIYERSTQQTSQHSAGNSAAADDDDDAFDEEDDDDDDETNDSVENVVDNDAEELLLLQQKARQQAAEAAKNAPNSAEQNDKDDSAEAVPSWASSLAVKFGVGVALALVARLVLIRNNPNTNEEPSPEVIMKRRLTIATAEDTYDNDEEEPPLLDDGEYSEEEIEIEEEYEYEEDEEIELPEDLDDNLSALAGEYIPETFEQLNSLYRSHLSEPDSGASSSNPQRVEEVRDQRFVAKKQPAVFNAPPPPTTTDKSYKKVSPFTATTTTTATAQSFTPTLKQTQSPTTTTTSSTKDETIKRNPNFNTTTTKPTTAADLYSAKSNIKQYIPDSPKTTKHEVTHDLDYQPDEEDIDYDDDEDVEGVDDDGVGGTYTRDILDDTDEEDEVDEDEDEEEDDDLLDDEDISDVDDTELMNRLEAKYGRLPAKEYESDEDPDDPTWTQIKPKEELGGGPQAQNDDFDSYEHELRRANEDIMRENYAIAVKRFAELVQRFPDRPAVFLGQATVLDKLSERQRSNTLLTQALLAYKRYFALGNAVTDHAQFRATAERCIERMRFMGHHMQAVPIHLQLIARFINEPDVRNQLAITFLLQNRLSDAKLVLQEVLRRWPKDGFAQVHYGFVLRQLDKDYKNAVIYLRAGIKSKAPGTQDGRFYFNLGDSLQRLGRQAEAVEVYKRGAALKLFPSVYQRSLYNEPDLRAQPYWTKVETTYAVYLNQLERNWRAIRDEALSLLGRRGNYLDETESLRDTGDWQQFELYSRGQRRVQNCQKAPITCGLIEKFTAAAGCRRGQVKFSIMQPGTHVHAHCGPTNCRLRAHLGLVVPPGPRLRVAEEERTWNEGEFLIFDDSFEHEVWHNGTSLRLVLIIDVWHPDLSEIKRRTLSAI
ncbi:uncharacterized protein LOC105209240 isoform X2 [Zeugodacus cucurbitae]|uniref:uncharacterized protein LOC105209240 isoform X2 n=1 Tax=Zeugodacus cucurbitae TaxID=28588 RepID=UPI0023D8E52B|nr:uncharacterized protein LOC105209240 isoform X2 [Zeugodacus cucurbitae]